MSLTITSELITKQQSKNGLPWALPEMLAELVREGDSELVLDLIGVFETDTAIRLHCMRNAVANGDRAILRAAAHSIKGSSFQMGASILAGICEQLESVTSDVPVAQILNSAEAAEIEFASVCRAMASYLSDGGNPSLR